MLYLTALMNSTGKKVNWIISKKYQKTFFNSMNHYKRDSHVYFMHTLYGIAHVFKLWPYWLSLTVSRVFEISLIKFDSIEKSYIHLSVSIEKYTTKKVIFHTWPTRCLLGYEPVQTHSESFSINLKLVFKFPFRFSKWSERRYIIKHLQLSSNPDYDCGMGWFQVHFSRKGHMSRPRNWYSKEFSQIAIEICLKKCAIPTDLDFGVLSIKSMFFVFFWAKHKPQLKFFYRDMVYIILIYLLNQVT